MKPIDQVARCLIIIAGCALLTLVACAEDVTFNAHADADSDIVPDTVHNTTPDTGFDTTHDANDTNSPDTAHDANDTDSPDTDSPDTVSIEDTSDVSLLEDVTEDVTEDVHDEAPIVPIVPVVIAITSPVDTVHTNATVRIEVEVIEGSPISVSLQRNGALLATLEPPYVFDWNTLTVPEATHTITAHAIDADGGLSESSSRTVIVDRTHPTVVSNSPLHMSDIVAVGEPIVITFSEAILAASVVHDDAIVVRADGVALSKTIVLSEQDTVITIKLDALPKLPAAMDVQIDMQHLTDRAGNALDKTLSWQWSYPAWLIEFDGLQMPHGANTILGDAVLDDDDLYLSLIHSGGLNVLIRRSNTLYFLGSVETTNPRIHQARLRVAPNKHLWIARTEFTTTPGSPTDVYYHVSKWDGVDWTDFGRVFTSYNAYSSANITWLGRGHDTVAYTRHNSSEPNSYVALARWTGSAWLAQGQEIDSYDGGNFGATINADDEPVVISRMFIGNGNYEIIARRLVGSTWVAMGTRANAGADPWMIDPSIDCTPPGVCVAAWAEQSPGGSSNSIRARRWDGSAWQNLGSTFRDDEQPDSYPYGTRVRLDRQGVPYIVWWQFSQNNAFHMRYFIARWDQTSASWQRLGKAIGLGSYNYILEPRLVFDKDNVPFVAFSDGAPASVSLMRLNQ
ncbi:MAG: Ig-like domain-containing protein [Bradymonadaceae bacterium]|nr:Ig-like domain-containing protein [Lujinxingiaceae bacterium]